MGTKDGGYSTAKSCWLQRMTALVIVVVLVVMVVVKLTQMSSHYQ